MFRPIPAIIRFSSESVLVFIRFMRLFSDGEISSSVVLVITTIKRSGWEGEGGSVMWVLHPQSAQYPHYRTPPSPSQPLLLIVVITKTTDDEISPSLHNRLSLINTKTLSDENLMMAGIGRNM